MTKEELEKEAEEYRKEKLKEQKDKFVFELPEVYVADIKQAYLAGAEPREKEIKSLGERCLQLQKDKGNLTDRVQELEAQIEKMKCCRNCRHPKTPIDNTCVDCERFSKWELRR